MQNELIAICGRQLQQVIVSECNSATCFSVIADETTDVPTTEQISLCLRDRQLIFTHFKTPAVSRLTQVAFY
jgi:hypothetical protein